MKKIFFTLILLFITANFVAGRSQTRVSTLKPAKPNPVKLEDIALGPPQINGEVIRVSGEYRLRIDNNDEKRAFQGLAVISFGDALQQLESVKVKLSIAPLDSETHLLYSMPTIGEQYKLIVLDQSGSVVIHKIAPVKNSTDPLLTAPPPQPVSTVPVKSDGGAFIRVRPRLAGGANEKDPYILAFEINSATPLANAQIRVTAKGLNESRPLNFTGAVNVDIPLPDDLEVQKITYAIINNKGETLVSGEADVMQLMNADDVAIGNIKLDKAAYKAGESAQLTVEYAGNTPSGIRVEITAKDLTGKIIHRDTRKEKREAGLPPHEFVISLPKDVKDAVSVEIKIFEGDGNSLLDSSSKDIIISNN